MRESGLEREGQRFGVHMRDHQQFAIAGIGHDGRDQTLLVETRGEGRAAFQFGLVLRGDAKVSVIV